MIFGRTTANSDVNVSKKSLSRKLCYKMFHRAFTHPKHTQLHTCEHGNTRIHDEFRLFLSAIHVTTLIEPFHYSAAPHAGVNNNNIDTVAGEQHHRHHKDTPPLSHR